MIFDEVVTITENKKLNGKYFKLTFQSSRLSRKAEPGQFLNVLIEEGMDPFLRRPFSYYRIRGSRIEILYEILGKGSGLLAKKKKGDEIRVLGPLGRGFSTGKTKRKRILVAGGCGLPPLVFLAERYGAEFLLIGARSRGEVMPKRELKLVKAKVLYSTDDGSYGTKGLVTRLLEDLLKNYRPSNFFIQTCGPRMMMQAVMDLARRKRISGEASLDENMACGIGACLGCVVKTKDGFVPSCTEGPVFRFDEIKESLASKDFRDRSRCRH